MSVCHGEQKRPLLRHLGQSSDPRFGGRGHQVACVKGLLFVSMIYSKAPIHTAVVSCLNGIHQLLLRNSLAAMGVA